MSEDATLDEFIRAKSEENIGSEWNESKLEDLLSELLTGGRPTGGGVDEGEYISIGGTQVDSEGYIDLQDLVYIPEDYFEKVEETQLQKHDILVVKDGANTGDVAIAWESDDRIVTNEHLFTLRADSSINSPYLFYFLLSHQGWKQINGTITGSAQEGINRGFTGKVDIQYPPLSEQRKIATVLYTVDRAVEKTEEIESQLRRTQKGIVQQTLKYGLGESDISDTGTKLGEVPSHWELTSVDEIVADGEHSFTDGARYALSSDEIHDEGEARAILLQEVGEGEFNDEDPKFATDEKYNEITHRAIYPGEVVVAKMAEPVARACIVPDKYDKYLLGCADVVRIQTNDEFDSRFLMYCMNSYKVWRQAVAHLRGTGRSRINLENIAELKLPKPPLTEQIEIADLLESFDQRIQTERNYRDRLRRLKTGLMQDLLTGIVRTTDTNIEVPEEIEQYG